jgi:hypothetical protein
MYISRSCSTPVLFLLLSLSLPLCLSVSLFSERGVRDLLFVFVSEEDVWRFTFPFFEGLLCNVVILSDNSCFHYVTVSTGDYSKRRRWFEKWRFLLARMLLSMWVFFFIIILLAEELRIFLLDQFFVILTVVCEKFVNVGLLYFNCRDQRVLKCFSFLLQKCSLIVRKLEQ